MKANNFLRNSADIGRPAFEYPNQPILTVLQYIEEYLPILQHHNKEELKLKNERGLTQTLIRILNANLDDKYPFFFDKEGMQDLRTGNSPAVDIETIAKIPLLINYRNIMPQEAFFALEAKVLGVEKKHRLKEYVIGFDEDNNPKACGGIERFKKAIYSKQLAHVGIIGYMLKEDFDYWLAQINSWIHELAEDAGNNNFWHEQDKLIPMQSDLKGVAKYISISKRLYNGKEINPVSIFHLWVDLK